jgi:Na+/phosphate symporter
MGVAKPLLLAAYLVFCAAVSAFALGSFAKIVERYLAVGYDYRTEFLMVVGQVGFQWLFMRSSSWAARRTYAVVALSVSMIGSVLLLPLLAIHHASPVTPLFATAWFFAVVGVIFVVHHAIILRLRLPQHLTVTWVLYRLLLLAYVLLPRSPAQ